MGRKSIGLTGDDVKELGKWLPANGWKLRKGKPGTDVLFTAEKKPYGVLCVQKSASNNPRKPYEIRAEKTESASLAHVVINGFRKDMNRKNRSNEPPEADSVSFFPGRPLTEKEIRALGKQKESPLRAADCDINIAAIYERYNHWLRDQHLMDYDDQMVYALTILRKVPQVLEYFQEQYRYICVDEAQDTSRIQHTIIALLASKHDNLFMVGDEDQSIYGFRAACPEALINFEREHRGAKVLLMEQNYRSGSGIVRAADRFIQRNTLRHAKHMICADRIAGGTSGPDRISGGYFPREGVGSRLPLYSFNNSCQ